MTISKILCFSFMFQISLWQGFFRRANLRNPEESVFICFNNSTCIVNRSNRNKCRACRLRRCYEVGMDFGDGKFCYYYGKVLRRKFLVFFSNEQEMNLTKGVAVIDLASYRIHFLHRFVFGRDQCHRQTFWNVWASL